MLRLCSRVFYSSCTVRNSENICISSGGAQEKGKREGMKLSLLPKLVEKTSLGSNYFILVKISFRVTHLMPYYAETDSPPNRLIA
jgi:hypothetical protein